MLTVGEAWVVFLASALAGGSLVSLVWWALVRRTFNREGK